METALHYIQELQKMAEDLAAGVSDVTRYEEDSETFFTRLEHFVADNFPAQAAFAHTRMVQARSSMGYLLRGHGETDRHQMLLKRNLDNLYQTLKNPPQMGEEDEATASQPTYFA